MNRSISFNKIGMGTTLALIFAFAPFFAKAATLTRQLQFGMSGSDVRDLQTFLAEDPSVYPQGLVTGYFGSLTRAAVVRFQSKNGISAVGRVGPITLAAINARMGTGGGGSSVGTGSSMQVIGPVTVSVGTSTQTTGSGTSTATSTVGQQVISWNTTIPTTAIIYYGTSPIAINEASETSGLVVNGNGVVVHGDLRTTHTATLPDLSRNTTYYYVILVRDASGASHITLPATFTTSSF